MTHLRKKMLDELQLRNYAQNTIRHYVRTVEDFARRFNCSPDRLGPRHVREYQAELFRKGKSPGTVRRHLAALRFFYVKTLRRAWSLADTPYPKKTHRLPTVLSREEVAQLMHAARTPGARILLMASGLECLLMIDDLNFYDATNRQRVHHVKVAAVTAQFARATRQVHSRPWLDNVGRGKKGITW